MPRKPSAATLAKRAAEAADLNAESVTTESPTLADEIRAELTAMEPVKKPAAETPAPATAPVAPPPLVDAAAIKDLIRKDKKIRFVVPEDPRGEIPVWERHFNGHVIVLKAGREYELPEFIVKEIRKSQRILELSAKTAEDFTATKSGKFLGTIS